MSVCRFQASLCSLGAVLMLASSSAAAVNESRLWLPRTHAAFRPQLLAAAKLAEQSPDCAEVVSGELDTARSTEQAPVFRIMCRNPAGYTYGMRVLNVGEADATVENVQSGKPATGTTSPQPNTKKQHDTIKADAGKIVAGHLEPVKNEKGRQLCEEAVRRRTSSMASVTIDMNDSERAVLADGSTQYDVDFDAKNPSGQPLLFHATCLISASAAVRVELRPRRQISAATKVQADEARVQSESDDDSAATQMPTQSAPSSAKPATDAPTVQPANEEEGWEVVE